MRPSNREPSPWRDRLRAVGLEHTDLESEKAALGSRATGGEVELPKRLEGGAHRARPMGTGLPRGAGEWFRVRPGVRRQCLQARPRGWYRRLAHPAFWGHA